MDYISKEAAISIFNAKADMALGTPKTCFLAAAKMIEALPAANVRPAGWFSVDDRLPEVGMQVLAYNRTGDMMVGTYSELGWFFPCYFAPVSHWMPLPEPPKEDA